MKLDGNTLPIEGLSRVPVTLEGNWESGRQRDWRGTIRALEPIVGLILLESNLGIEWCKSERAKADGLKTRLALFPYDTTNLDVQVSFSVHGAFLRLRTTIASPSYLPALAQRTTLETGVLFGFTVITGKPRIGLFVLFIRAREVQVGRNGLWHLRRSVAGKIADPYKQALTYGKTGRLQF